MSIATELADELLAISLRVRELNVVTIASGSGEINAGATVDGSIGAIANAVSILSSGAAVGGSGSSLASGTSNINAGATTGASGSSVVVQPPTSDKPSDIIKTNFDRAQLINFYEWWNGSSRYERFQRHIVLSGATAVVKVQKQDMYVGGGKRLPFIGTEYQITIDGKPVATFNPTGIAEVISVTIPLSGLTPGYHIVDVTPQYGTESSAAYPIFIPGQSKQDWIPIVTGSQEIGFGDFTDKTYRIQWVPNKFEPTVVPLPTQRVYQHFNTALSKSELNLEILTPHRGGYHHRAVRAKGGEFTTANKQWYTTWDMNGSIPRLPLIDGPRGRGAAGYLMHLEVGTAAPVETGPINNIYGLTPFSFIKLRENGTLLTLGGYRNKQPDGIGPYWETAGKEDYELVGNWDMDPTLWGHQELWGLAWNKASQVSNLEAPRIPEERNLHPHDTWLYDGVVQAAGIEAVVTDSRKNRLCKYKFSPTSHLTPPTITEFITGLQDPWDIVEWKDSYIVSERQANRIVQYGKDGRFERVVLQGANGLAGIDHSRLPWRIGTVAEIRAQPVCFPEGLYIIKDNLDNWLYYGSAVMGQIRRVDLVTGEIQIVQSVSSTTGPRTFNKLAVSDGTFGPRGTIFLSDWTVLNFGFPFAYLPTMNVQWNAGTPVDPIEKATTWSYVASPSSAKPKGPGGVWDGWGYTGAVGVGNGRLVGGGAHEGIFEITRKLPGTLPYTSQVNIGATKWHDRGYYKTHGANGFGFYGLPLPWGDPDIDYFLTVHGHIKP